MYETKRKEIILVKDVKTQDGIYVSRVARYTALTFDGRKVISVEKANLKLVEKEARCAYVSDE